jgi:hypothetical protein
MIDKLVKQEQEVARKVVYERVPYDNLVPGQSGFETEMLCTLNDFSHLVNPN